MQADQTKITKSRAQFLDELQRERSGRSPIDALPAERQQLLFDLLNQYDATVVEKMIAEPEPLGWNFKIHVSSLKRFYHRYQRQRDQAERLRAIAENTKIIQELGPSNAKAVEAAQNLIKLRFIDTARNELASNQDLQILSRILDRQRRTDLAERKQQFTEQQTITKP